MAKKRFLSVGTNVQFHFVAMPKRENNNRKIAKYPTLMRKGVICGVRKLMEGYCDPGGVSRGGYYAEDEWEAPSFSAARAVYLYEVRTEAMCAAPTLVHIEDVQVIEEVVELRDFPRGQRWTQEQKDREKEYWAKNPMSRDSKGRFLKEDPV